MSLIHEAFLLPRHPNETIPIRLSNAYSKILVLQNLDLRTAVPPHAIYQVLCSDPISTGPARARMLARLQERIECSGRIGE